MTGLTTALLDQACRIFFAHAYPGGGPEVPASKRAYACLNLDTPLADLLKPPVCQAVSGPDGQSLGYAFRLGSAHYPHLKLQVIRCEGEGALVFSVDMHDTIPFPANPEEAARLAQIQAKNREVKEHVERAWEAGGIMTFNGLLRRDLDKRPAPVHRS